MLVYYNVSPIDMCECALLEAKCCLQQLQKFVLSNSVIFPIVLKCPISGLSFIKLINFS